MPFIQWSEQLSVQINAIDQEHRKLIEMINELHQSILENHIGGTKDTTHRVISEMVAYANQHFSREEQYMKLFQFPGLLVHQQEHRAFLEKALELKKMTEMGEYIFTIEVVNYLRQWLKFHIVGTDKQYIQTFHEHGLE